MIIIIFIINNILNIILIKIAVDTNIIEANVVVIIQNIRKTDFMQMLLNVISIIMDTVSNFLNINTIAGLNRRSRAENNTTMALFLAEPL